MASSSKSWGFDPTDDEDIYVCLFISRNKDNKDVPNFVERRKSFITTKHYTNLKLISEFNHFVNDGVPNEMCRMYYSLNSRKKEVVHKQLLHFLIDEPNFNLCALQSKIASIAAKKECAKTKYWFFDFDIQDIEKVKEFMNDIHNIDNNIIVFSRATPNGYAIITNRGFDTRELFKKWTENVTLKKDDLICIRWNEPITDKEVDKAVYFLNTNKIPYKNEDGSLKSVYEMLKQIADDYN